MGLTPTGPGVGRRGSVCRKRRKGKEKERWRSREFTGKNECKWKRCEKGGR